MSSRSTPTGRPTRRRKKRRFFTLPSESKLIGRIQMLRDRIPKVEITKGGNFVLRWSDGMKLSDLLAFVGQASDPGEGTIADTAAYEED